MESRRRAAFVFTEVFAMLILLCALTLEQVRPVQILPARALDEIRQSLPDVDDPETQRILRDAGTLWYDEESMPQAYQDPIPPITGLRNPSSPVAPAEIFAGGRFRFPWGFTAGTHRCGPAVSTVKFVALPRVRDVLLPVVYWREGLEYRWVFPRRTMVGEVLYLSHPSNGHRYVFEIRTRTKEPDQWTVNVLRPYPTSTHLYRRLEEIGQGSSRLARHLQDPPVLPAAALADGFGAMRSDGHIDVLPPIDDDLAIRLLQTPFLSCHGERWMADRSSDGPASYAPTTDDPFSIVPANYDGGVLEVSDANCAQCHQNCSEPIALFDSQRVLYGRIWGSDQVFSWHPFDPIHVLADEDYAGGDGNLRRSFLDAGIVQPFDADRHLPDYYTVLPRRE